VTAVHQLVLALLFLAGCSATAPCPDDGKFSSAPCRSSRGSVVTVTSGGSVAVGATVGAPK
jgi:hypothetical protein